MDLIKIALSQYGVKEIVGSNHNDEVLKYFQDAGHEWVKDDETAWCSAFVNWVAMKSIKEHTGKLNARSWLDVGDEVSSPLVGDVVIFYRGDPKGWKGHVGFYISEDDKNINVLGGNQSNMVCIKPYSKSRLLGYRRLRN